MITNTWTDHHVKGRSSAQHECTNMSWGRWSPCQIYAGTYNWGDVGKHIWTKYNQCNMDEPTCQGVGDHHQIDRPPCQGVGDHQQSKTLRIKWSSQRSDICLSVNESSLCFAPYQLREKREGKKGWERERRNGERRNGERKRGGVEREKRERERKEEGERERFRRVGYHMTLPVISNQDFPINCCDTDDMFKAS